MALRAVDASTGSTSVKHAAQATLQASRAPAGGRRSVLSIKGGGADEFKDRYTEQAIANLRRAVDGAYAGAATKEVVGRIRQASAAAGCGVVLRYGKNDVDGVITLAREVGSRTRFASPSSQPTQPSPA